MASNVTAELSSLIQKLQEERQSHIRAIAEIDEVFAKFGIQVSEGRRRGRPPRAQAGRAGGLMIGAPGPKRRGRKPRGNFAKSGPESILDFVKNKGKGGASSLEISRHWKTEGRAGQPFVTLGQLIRSKRLRKQAVKGQRGSQYFAA